MIRIRTASGERRYVKPVYAANRRLKPLHALIDGKPVQHPEGVYALRFKNPQGKYTWEHVGSDAEAAQTAKLRRDNLLRSGALGLAVAAPVAVPTPAAEAEIGVLLQDKIDAYHVSIEGRRPVPSRLTGLRLRRSWRPAGRSSWQMWTAKTSTRWSPI